MFSDFASRILKKYGWEENTGLGKNRNGIVEPIKAFMKSTNTGIGYVQNNNYALTSLDIRYQAISDRIRNVLPESNKDITAKSQYNKYFHHAGQLHEPNKDESIEKRSKKLKKQKSKKRKYNDVGVNDVFESKKKKRKYKVESNFEVENKKLDSNLDEQNMISHDKKHSYKNNIDDNLEVKIKKSKKSKNKVDIVDKIPVLIVNEKFPEYIDNNKIVEKKKSKKLKCNEELKVTENVDVAKKTSNSSNNDEINVKVKKKKSKKSERDYTNTCILDEDNGKEITETKIKKKSRKSNTEENDTDISQIKDKNKTDNMHGNQISRYNACRGKLGRLKLLGY